MTMGRDSDLRRERERRRMQRALLYSAENPAKETREQTNRRWRQENTDLGRVTKRQERGDESKVGAVSMQG